MARIIPFRGIYYNKEKVYDLRLVLTPPYDTISLEEQLKFYKLSKYNFIRIILGREEPYDNEQNNRYTRAAAYFEDWFKEGILRMDDVVSIYVYSQEFHHNGRQLERIGFIALLELEEFESGIVYPHEMTLSKHKEDRMRLLKATRLNAEPIFILYEDREGMIRDTILRVRGDTPFIDVEYEGGRHRLFSINDKVSIANIQKGLEKESIYIADGHHRYEASLEYRRKKGNYNYIMVYMVDIDDEALLILPAHRLIRPLRREGLEGIIKRIERYFIKERIPSIEGLTNRLNLYKDDYIFGLYMDGESSLLILKDKGIINKGKIPPVSILHSLILDTYKTEIGYTTSWQEAKDLVDKREYQMAFLLNPPKISQVKEVALARGVMPGKATYFYPKPLSGLIMNKF